MHTDRDARTFAAALALSALTGALDARAAPSEPPAMAQMGCLCVLVTGSASGKPLANTELMLLAAGPAATQIHLAAACSAKFRRATTSCSSHGFHIGTKSP